MNWQTILKLIIFNMLLSLINIFLFSNAFFHLDISGASALGTAFGMMVIVTSIASFFTVNYKLLAKKPEPLMLKDRDIGTLEDCITAATLYMRNNVKTFQDDLKTIVYQAQRMKKKKSTVHEILLERFSSTEMSFEKFSSAVDGIEKIMILNIKSLMSRINAFDEEEYEKLIEGQKSSQTQQGKVLQSRVDIYNDYIAFSSKAVENNEQMLIRLDQLILEISKLNSLSEGDIEDMDAIKDIESLISDAKWYK